MVNLLSQLALRSGTEFAERKQFTLGVEHRPGRAAFVTIRSCGCIRKIATEVKLDLSAGTAICAGTGLSRGRAGEASRMLPLRLQSKPRLG